MEATTSISPWLSGTPFPTHPFPLEDLENRNTPKPGMCPEAVSSHGIVSIYLNEIGRVSLLTSDAEHFLFRRLDRFKTAQTQLRDHLQKIGVRFEETEPLVSALADARILERVRRYRTVTGAVEKVRAQIIEANLRLAVALARKHQGRGLSLLDLIQEANLGLIRAVDKFDHKRGVRFAAYACWWIQQALGLATASQARMIRLPVYLLEWQRRLRRIAQSDMSEPDAVRQAAEAVGITEAQAKRALELDLDVTSLDTPTAASDAITVGETIEDMDTPRPDRAAEDAQLRSEIESALAHLDPRSQRVLRLRYGFEDGVSYSLQEVGEALSLSRERIRQIELAALNRLRHPSRLSRLESFYRVS